MSEMISHHCTVNRGSARVFAFSEMQGGDTFFFWSYDLVPMAVSFSIYVS
jgi:hypothetical protein